MASASGYSVRGTVVSSATGQAVARAMVDLNGRYAMLTGGDGQFSFDHVPAGTYLVTVRRPGFIGLGTSSRGFQARGAFPVRPGPARRVLVGADMPNLTFRITPEAAIAGTVTLSTADPADGIQVSIFREQMESGHRHWALGGTTQTNSQGAFRFSGLPPGSYMVATQPTLDQPGMSSPISGAVWGYPGLYYPGVTDPDSAGVLTLAPGQQAEADITLTRQQFFPVTALVRNSDPGLSASVQILDRGGRPAFLPAQFDNRAQMVHTHVPSGTWNLDMHAYARTQFWGRRQFQVSGGPASLVIDLVPVSQIPVMVHREFSSPAGGGQGAPDAGPGLNLFLVSADMFGMGGFGMAQSRAGGPSWEIDVNEPGRYWVVADAYSPAYVSSITSAGLDLASNPLTVAPGGSPGPIEVTLRDDSGTIAGQINLRGLPGTALSVGEQRQVWVYAIPLFATSEQAPSTVVGDTGQFTFSGLAPGSWRVVACDSPQQIDIHSPDAMAVWDGKGQTTTVDPGGTASVQLDVIHMEAVQ